MPGEIREGPHLDGEIKEKSDHLDNSSMPSPARPTADGRQRRTDARCMPGRNARAWRPRGQ
eukprot:9373001-Pyramimonas_sp.AAC.1